MEYFQNISSILRCYVGIVAYRHRAANKISRLAVENIIDTRYLNIFRFFDSKYSPPVSIHFLQRFNRYSNACSSLFCARVVAVLMVEMSLKKHSSNFNFNFGNGEKSHGAKSGEYGGWFNTHIWFRAKNWRHLSKCLEEIFYKPLFCPNPREEWFGSFLCWCLRQDPAL